MKKLVSYLSVFVLGGYLILAFITRFKNPELTETQLLIEYPYIWIAIIVSALTYAFTVKTDED